MKKIDIEQVSSIFLEFVDYLHTNKVIYAIVSELGDYPQISTDIDMIVADQRRFIAELKKFCSLNDLHIASYYEHSTGIRCDIVKLLPKGNIVHFPGPDILRFATWKLKRNSGFSLSAAIKRRVMDPRGFFTLSPQDMFQFYIIRRADKRNIGNKQIEFLNSIRSSQKTVIDAAVKDSFGKSGQEAVHKIITLKDNDETSKSLQILNEIIARNSSMDIKRHLWEFGRLSRRLVTPPGLTISFLGPDGSGKSSVIKGIIEQLFPILRNVERYHIFPDLPIDSGVQTEPVVDPHNQKPRGLAESAAKVGYYVYRYWVGWVTRIVRGRMRSAHVIFDRYYHDMLVDPIRYRYGGPMWLARLGGRLIPKPDLWILLDAPAEVLQARKQEVPFEETARQSQAYRQLIKGFDNAIVIDASQPLDDVVAATSTAVLQFMTERTNKRLKKYDIR